MTNGILHENLLKQDYVKLANFLKMDYDKVYAYYLPTYYFFGILTCDYKKIENNNGIEEDTTNKKVAVIVTHDYQGEITGAKKVDIGTKYIDVYVSDNSSDVLKVK